VPLDARFVTLVLLQVLLAFVLPQVGHVLDEQHHEDVILVLRGVQRAAERVARLPEDIVDFLLRDLFAHGLFLYASDRVTANRVYQLLLLCVELGLKLLPLAP